MESESDEKLKINIYPPELEIISNNNQSIHIKEGNLKKMKEIKLSVASARKKKNEDEEIDDEEKKNDENKKIKIKLMKK